MANDQENLPAFLPVGGFFQDPFSLEIVTEEVGDSILYTLDGSSPNANSTVYTKPIFIDKTTVVRAISRKDIGLELPLTQSYLVNEVINLPVFSLATDAQNLFSDENGIYVTGTNGIPGMCDKLPRNLNQDWERPVNVEFFEKDGVSKINQIAGVKIFGGCSRTRRPMKTLALFARAEYGKGSFNHQLFPDKPIADFESFLLRPSADDQAQTLFRDALAQYALIEYMAIDYQAYRPAVVFINGKYWGIHNIREKVNESYLESNFDVDKTAVTILDKDGKIVQGNDNSHYKAMIGFVEKNNLSVKENYEYIKKQMDVEQYIDYQIANIYLAETDWPGNNIKFWRAENSMYDRWRWLQYDRDQTFKNTNYNALAKATEVDCHCTWPNPPWSTVLFRQLLKNDEFRNQFIQLFAYHMATTFEPNRLIKLIDQFSNGIEAEIPRHVGRWGGVKVEDSGEGWSEANFASVDEWKKHVQAMKSFANNRPQYAATHLQSYFKIANRANVSIESENPDEGYVMLYNKKIPESGYRFNHFQHATMELTAIPKTGYSFSHWVQTTTESKTITEQVFQFAPNQNTTIKAFFVANNQPNVSVVISEINYHSNDDFDTGDWLELYNRQNQQIDLTDWYIKDSNDSNTFYLPTKTLLKGNHYLVICSDMLLLKQHFPEGTNNIGQFDFKLSKSGDLIRLYNNYDQLVDSVRFDDQFPWPIQTDGVGYTMELIDVAMNNDNAENWQASLEIGGTPGWANGELVTSVRLNSDNHLNFMVYPNPVTHNATISFDLHEKNRVNIDLFDLLGAKKMCILNETLDKGTHLAQFSRQNLKPGIYLVQLSALNQQPKVLKLSVL